MAELRRQQNWIPGSDVHYTLGVTLCSKAHFAAAAEELAQLFMPNRTTPRPTTRWERCLSRTVTYELCYCIAGSHSNAAGVCCARITLQPCFRQLGDSGVPPRKAAPEWKSQNRRPAIRRRSLQQIRAQASQRGRPGGRHFAISRRDQFFAQTMPPPTLN